MAKKTKKYTPKGLDLKPEPVYKLKAEATKAYWENKMIGDNKYHFNRHTGKTQTDREILADLQVKKAFKLGKFSKKKK